VPKQLKVLLYKTNTDIWLITQKQERRIEATKMRMLRHIHGINWEDHVRNEDIRSEAKVKLVSRHMRRRL